MKEKFTTETFYFQNVNVFFFFSCCNFRHFCIWVYWDRLTFKTSLKRPVKELQFDFLTLKVAAVCASLLTVHQVTLLKIVVWLKGSRVDAEVRSDVVVQVPGLVFIVYHKEQSKLLVHVTPLSVGPIAVTQCAAPADNQRPQETAVQILNINKRTRSVTNILLLLSKHASSYISSTKTRWKKCIHVTVTTNREYAPWRN